jgi:hypothetical protein
MNSPELEIVITPQGKIEIEVKGVQGPGCKDLTRALENALGEVDERELKAEYYASNSASDGDYQYQQY